MQSDGLKDSLTTFRSDEGVEGEVGRVAPFEALDEQTWEVDVPTHLFPRQSSLQMKMWEKFRNSHAVLDPPRFTQE